MTLNLKEWSIFLVNTFYLDRVDDTELDGMVDVLYEQGFFVDLVQPRTGPRLGPDTECELHALSISCLDRASPV